MKNISSLVHKNTVAALLALTASGILLPAVAHADNCPEAKETFEKAIKDGIGAQWQQGEKLKWYLDAFSNNIKPTDAAANKFTFMQANYENNQLTCYYEWPNDDGKSMNWLSVRLRTTQKLKPAWTGATCSNFEAANCQFTFEEAAAGAAPGAAPGAPK